MSHYVIFNLSSTHAEQGKSRIRELKLILGLQKLHVINTIPGDFVQNRKNIEKISVNFDENTVIYVAAGDGTVGSIIETLTTSKKISDKARQAAILPLWCGNANDLANMLNGKAPNSLAKLLKKTKVVSITPLCCKLECDDGVKYDRIATCYISFGASAYAAKHINSTNHRHNPLHNLLGVRILSEIAASINGLIEAPVFRIEENGSIETIYERLITNGPRFAKNSLAPTRLTNHNFHMETFRRKSIFRFMAQAFDYVSRRSNNFYNQDVQFIC